MCFEDVFPHCFLMRTLKFHGELCFWLKKHINKKASRWSIKSNAWFMTPFVVMFTHHELHWRPNIDSQPIFRWTKTGFGGSCGNFWLPALPSTDSWLWCSTASSGKFAQNWVSPGQILEIFRFNLVCLCKKCPFFEWMVPCCFQVFSMWRVSRSDEDFFIQGFEARHESTIVNIITGNLWLTTPNANPPQKTRPYLLIGGGIGGYHQIPMISSLGVILNQHMRSSAAKLWTFDKVIWEALKYCIPWRGLVKNPGKCLVIAWGWYFFVFGWHGAYS